MRNSPQQLSLLIFAIAPLLTNCVTSPICPSQLLPIVEVQVNDTASNHDDYGSTSADTTCRARIANPTDFDGAVNFPGGVQIELRNPPGASSIVYGAPGGTASVGSQFQVLPGDGSWSAFVVRGTATNTADKSAVIEMSTTGTCDEVVLARKAMMFPSGAPPIPTSPARPRVEMEIGGVATLDDYFGWRPTFSRIRWADGTAPATLNVTLQNMSGTDHLRFGTTDTVPVTGATLPLALPGDGTWVSFYVAGNFASPSTRDKDALLDVVETGSGNLLSREGVMVRIRKNANTLSADERDRYLAALRKMNLTFTDYIKFVQTHSRDAGAADITSHRQAHSGSAFLPWHRAFVLHLERILQAADPSVTLPYWKFDANAPNMFVPDFMGANSSGNMATLSATNPIVSWSLAGEGVPLGIQRNTPYGNGGHPATDSEVTTLGLGGSGSTANYAAFKSMEQTTHNPAHSNSGGGVQGGSWIGGSPAIATRDPLFFFLHCNVDRLWAKWQWLRDRNGTTDAKAYDLQGSHASPAPGTAAPSLVFSSTGAILANRTLGQYALDTMWPWDNVLNGTGTALRPTGAILTPFPVGFLVLPFGPPTVTSMIEPRMVGAFYDDVFPY